MGDTHACGPRLIELAGNLEKALELIATQERLSVEELCEKYAVLCAKGGKQNITNEYTRQARNLPKEVDPCEWLRQKYKDAFTGGDSKEALKIKQAQKTLGCRPNANDY